MLQVRAAKGTDCGGISDNRVKSHVTCMRLRYPRSYVMAAAPRGGFNSVYVGLGNKRVLCYKSRAPRSLSKTWNYFLAQATGKLRK